MNELAFIIEGILDVPVVDETGLDGRYHIDLPGPHASVEILLRALTDRAGLVLTGAKREIEMVVVQCG